MGLVAYFTAMRKTDSGARPSGVCDGKLRGMASRKSASTKKAHFRVMPIWSDGETKP